MTIGAPATPPPPGFAHTDPAETVPVQHVVAGARERRLGLRRRIILMFALGTLALSVILSMVAYGFIRSSLVDLSDRSARETGRSNAVAVLDDLSGKPPSAQKTIDRLNDRGVKYPQIYYNETFAGNATYGEDQIPRALFNRVITDRTPTRMVLQINQQPVILVGFPLPGSTAGYFEFFSMAEVDATLRSVRVSIFLAAGITTVLGLVAGSLAARRAVRPVGVAAQAAKAIAGGRLDTRLEPTEDPDLSVLATSFNDMATALETRIDRDARFASDVSHELRSPLMTLSASVEVMEARRDEMPERAQAALDLLSSDVTRFKGLVEDLLEISRFDAGAVRLHREELLVAEFVRHAIKISSVPDTPIIVTDRAEKLLIEGDRRRLARVIANFVDNARVHGGGQPELSITEVVNSTDTITHVRIAVEDHGTGVPPEERELVFERFARGGVAGRRAANDGAGLGLALVDEHVRMHGGRVWLDDRLDGEPGARFVIEFDAEELDE